MKASRCICVKRRWASTNGRSTYGDVCLLIKMDNCVLTHSSILVYKRLFSQSQLLGINYYHDKWNYLISFLVEKYCLFELKWTFKTIGSCKKKVIITAIFIQKIWISTQQLSLYLWKTYRVIINYFLSFKKLSWGIFWIKTILYHFIDASQKYYRVDISIFFLEIKKQRFLYQHFKQL